MSKKYNTEEFISKCESVHNNVYDYSDTKYINSHTKIRINCNEHGIFNLRAGDHLFGYGCPKCNNMYLNTKKFIEKANLIHGDEYDYSLVNYLNAKTKIIIVCRKHGEFSQRTGDHLSGSGCPQCTSSKGELIIEKFLIENNIIFERERIFDKCRGVKRTLPFDFYLPQHNQLIEFDGEQHFKNIKYWGGIDKLKIQQKNDLIKNSFAKKMNINLLRIKFDEINNINNILKEAI